MGLKRTFDEEGLQELSFKHPKQLDSDNSCGAPQKPTSLPDINPSCGAFQKTDTSGDAIGDFCDSLSKNDSSNAPSKFNCTPVSSGTNGNREEDIGSQTMLYSCVNPESFEFTFPRHNFIQFKDAYSSLLNSPPTKEVPIGPDHQAEIPEGDLTVSYIHSIDFINGIVNYSGGFIMGSCVIPMPELELSDDIGKAIDSKIDCNCLDADSVRCVQQHVKEAREELKGKIGLEKFVGLGFLEMGEEVAYKWTEEEEDLFHEVVYGNPVSYRRNFWVHLSTMFPSRSKEDLVSYYFNVFMLRRRAAQNRSSWLETDSDDDEWKGIGGPFGMTGEDERSAAISFNQDVLVDHGDDSQHEYDDDDDDDDSSSDDNDDDNDNGDEHDIEDNDDGDPQVGKVGATENLERESHSRKGDDEYSDDHRFNHMPHHLAKSLGSFKEFLDVEENSCTSFEIQPCVNGSHHPIYERGAFQETKVNGACEKLSDVNCDGSTDKFGCHYSVDFCDSKVWDVTYPVGPMEAVDLLPTYNMMEEIFGPCNWNKSNNVKWLP
ncbi:HTH myb-type domain-containing protein [Heracleum sosnowskyi]|uniref:HTH myb-type domain-containing protein n=1 Tax=Heracleum sosnowskyi TaxID=360622 RepID=A0AAD8HWC2_9APIA|nr:HTH myb-type domain-containing protein [Heracleum sosnowskyi]